jgi:hypothetical protein
MSSDRIVLECQSRKLSKYGEKYGIVFGCHVLIRHEIYHKGFDLKHNVFKPLVLQQLGGEKDSR